MTTSCFCGCNLNDLDMIQCDCCSTWQHTVCVGFYSNRDHRIQSTNYICFNCRHKNDNATMKFIKNLASYRRALSVTFNEGFENAKQLADRLGYSLRATSRHINRMLEEKFIEKQGSSSRNKEYQVIKTKQVRDRLRQYFNYELTTFPVINDSEVVFMTQAKVTKPRNQQTPVKIKSEQLRTSVTELTMSCNDAMI